MPNIIFTDDTKQSLRMIRHLYGLLALLAFSIACKYFETRGLYKVDSSTFSAILMFFWSGLLLFTILIRTGINQRFPDPSLTMPQMLWSTTFLLSMVYILNEWRGLLLMTYFALLSFGYFRLNFRDFLSVALYAILGYLLVFIYLYLNEPERINVDKEFSRLVGFTLTTMVMIYTGSAISKLRTDNKARNLMLADALELNTRLATTDDLTGLYTRRYFMDVLEKQKALSERESSDFVICFADLDHFKHVNDSFGHHTGDVVLQKFADIIRDSIREIDCAARFGGEEFVLLLVNTDIEQSCNVADRIRQALEDYNFSDIAPALNVTVSIGLANYKQYNSLQETMMASDNRMYKAKEQGRNRVIHE